MAKPNSGGVNPGTPENKIQDNSIDLEAKLQEQLDNINAGSEPPVINEPTNNFGNSSEGSGSDNASDSNDKKKNSQPKIVYKYNPTLKANLDLFERNRLGKINKEKGTGIGVAKIKMQQFAFIAGYITKSDSRITFKKVTKTRADANNTAKKADVSYELKMVAPQKPDRVIVKYPMDLGQMISENSEDKINPNEIAKYTVSGDTAYNIEILHASKGNPEYFEWLSKYVPFPFFLRENANISIPYTKIKKNASGQVTSEVINPDPKVGVQLSAQIAGVLKNNSATGSSNIERVINYNGENDMDLKLVYKNSCRPNWIGIDENGNKNYIADKTFETIPVSAVKAEDAVELSRMYFRQYFDEDNISQLYRSKDQQDKGIALFELPNQAIKIQHTSEDSFTATPFTDTSYWNNVSVSHWYLTEVVNGVTVRKPIKGSEIQLVKRVEKTTQNSTPKNRSAYMDAVRTIKSTDWETSVPTLIQKALGEGWQNTFTYEMYQNSITTKTQGKKVKSKPMVILDTPNARYEDIIATFKKTLSGNSIF